MNDSPLVFFSLEDARKLVAERDSLLRQYEEVNRKVQALAVLVPDHMRERIFGGQIITASGGANGTNHAGANGVVTPAAPPSPSLEDSIVDMLDDCLDVMSQDQIEAAVWEMPEFSNREKYTVSEIAKSLEKVSRRGRVMKRGMNYCSKKIARDGRVTFTGPTIVQAAERVLRFAKESLEPWEVIDRLKEDAEVGERVKQNPNGVYAALSRLASRRIAYRDADGYRIATR